MLYSQTQLWLRSIADTMFPRHCICCQRELTAAETGICTFCLADLPASYTWTNPSSPADTVFWGRAKIEKVTSLFLYNGSYRNLVYAIKYKGYARLGIRLGRMLGTKLTGLDIDIIVPVPLHPKKKRMRGYNQAEIVAGGILQELGKTQTGLAIETRLLLRKSFTQTQTVKDRADRWTNVQNAFCINQKRAKLLAGQLQAENKCRNTPPEKPHFLLVDDVLTTGATLDACAALLHSCMNCRVSIATLAYVL